jgi:hypothetical protein
MAPSPTRGNPVFLDRQLLGVLVGPASQRGSDRGLNGLAAPDVYGAWMRGGWADEPAQDHAHRG